MKGGSVAARAENAVRTLREIRAIEIDYIRRHDLRRSAGVRDRGSRRHAVDDSKVLNHVDGVHARPPCTTAAMTKRNGRIDPSRPAPRRNTRRKRSERCLVLA